jgi:coenzyme PQQ precursor peptide PqqA
VEAAALDLFSAAEAATSFRERPSEPMTEEHAMRWTTPTLVEICIGLEINGYLPAEF